MAFECAVIIAEGLRQSQTREDTAKTNWIRAYLHHRPLLRSGSIYLTYSEEQFNNTQHITRPSYSTYDWQATFTSAN